MKIIKKILDLIQLLTEYVLFVMVAAMVVIVFAQVIWRFILHASLPWSEEAARYLMVWMSMLGSSIALRKKGHIGVEALVMLFPAPVKKAVSFLTTLVAAGFFVGIIHYGIKVLKVVAPQESPAMEISMAIPYGALVVGGVLMLLYSIEELNALISSNKGGAHS
ncbi:TRAP transporter small permease protein [Synergistales bacterium]|nr:TRAP transporter small permease protein [Synergistales bacterium]